MLISWNLMYVWSEPLIVYVACKNNSHLSNGYNKLIFRAKEVSLRVPEIYLRLYKLTSDYFSSVMCIVNFKSTIFLNSIGKIIFWFVY